MAAAGVPAVHALDSNAPARGDAGAARGHRGGAGGRDAGAERRRVLPPAGVNALFNHPWALLAGWTHSLAFDVCIGGWEVSDAQWRGIPHLLIVPALVLTFLFGPAGLLRYLAIRWLAPDSGVKPPAIRDPRAPRAGPSDVPV